MEDRVARATEESQATNEEARQPKGAGPRLSFTRRLSKPGVDPFSTVEWEKRDAVIQSEGGKTVFEQRDVEFSDKVTVLNTE